MSRIYNAGATMRSKPETTRATTRPTSAYGSLSSTGRQDSVGPTGLRTFVGPLAATTTTAKASAVGGDPLRLVKAEVNPLSTQAKETLDMLEKQNEVKNEIKKSLSEDNDGYNWESSLSSWKSRRKSSSSYHPKVLDIVGDSIDPDSEFDGVERRKDAKTFRQMLQQRSDKGNNGSYMYHDDSFSVTQDEDVFTPRPPTNSERPPSLNTKQRPSTDSSRLDSSHGNAPPAAGTKVPGSSWQSKTSLSFDTSRDPHQVGSTGRRDWSQPSKDEGKAGAEPSWKRQSKTTVETDGKRTEFRRFGREGNLEQGGNKSGENQATSTLTEPRPTKVDLFMESRRNGLEPRRQHTTDKDWMVTSRNDVKPPAAQDRGITSSIVQTRSALYADLSNGNNKDKPNRSDSRGDSSWIGVHGKATGGKVTDRYRPEAEFKNRPSEPKSVSRDFVTNGTGSSWQPKTSDRVTSTVHMTLNSVQGSGSSRQADLHGDVNAKTYSWKKPETEFKVGHSEPVVAPNPIENDPSSDGSYRMTVKLATSRDGPERVSDSVHRSGSPELSRQIQVVRLSDTVGKTERLNRPEVEWNERQVTPECCVSTDRSEANNEDKIPSQCDSDPEELDEDQHSSHSVAENDTNFVDKLRDSMQPEVEIDQRRTQCRMPSDDEEDIVKYVAVDVPKVNHESEREQEERKTHDSDDEDREPDDGPPPLPVGPPPPLDWESDDE